MDTFILDEIVKYNNKVVRIVGTDVLPVKVDGKWTYSTYYYVKDIDGNNFVAQRLSKATKQERETYAMRT